MKALIMPLLAFSLLFLVACSDEEDDSADELAPTAPQKSPKDISKMSLHEGLKTKYSKLQFKCDYLRQVKRPNRFGGTTLHTIKDDMVLWDLLNEFALEKVVRFGDEFSDIRNVFEWKFKLSLSSEFSHSRDEGSGPVHYRLKNTPLLRGDFSSLIEEVHPSGRSKTRSNEQDGQQTFVDRVPMQAMNITFGPVSNSLWRTAIQLDCSIDAKVHPGFESDFIVN